MGINREDYKKVKKMNREQIDNLLVNYYHAGYNQGVSDMSNVSVMAISEGLQNTKGVGKKLYEDIMLNIKTAMETEPDDTE